MTPCLTVRDGLLSEIFEFDAPSNGVRLFAMPRP